MPPLDSGFSALTFLKGQFVFKPKMVRFLRVNLWLKRAPLWSRLIEHRSTYMKSNNSFWKSGHLPTLFSAFLYFDVSFMIWVLLGALGNYIASDLNLNAAQKGLMTAIPLLGGSILRLVFGQLSDRIGPWKTGCIGLTATLLPLLG